MAKKAKKSKIPKEIAGVKVPKELRKAGGAAARLIDSPLAGELMAAAFVAAAAALSQNDKARSGAAAASDAAGEDIRRETNRVKLAMKAAAGAIGKGLLDEFKAGKSRGR